MFIILAALLALEQLGSAGLAECVLRQVAPALQWVQNWMPLFYAPLLVALPLALRNVSSRDLARMAAVVAVGMPSTLLISAACVLGIRHMSGKEVQAQAQQPPPPPFTKAHAAAWGVLATSKYLPTELPRYLFAGSAEMFIS